MFKTMLATDAELDKLRFPLLSLRSWMVSQIRHVMVSCTRVVTSRSQCMFREKFNHLNTLDGELIVGHPTSKASTAILLATSWRTTSGILTFYVFDCIRDLRAEYMPSTMACWKPVKTLMRM